jgi:hypothetical protein
MYERKKVNTLSGYENVLDIYFVDKYGNVYGNDGIELVKNYNTSGYFQVALKIKNKRRWKKSFVHRLVALAFVDGMTVEKDIVDHIDGDKNNNYYKNLRWCTQKENMHNPNTVEKMWLNDTKCHECYVYDYLLNYIGHYDSLTEASKEIDATIEGLDVRVKEYYVLSNRNLETVLKINRKQRLQSVVITDINTHEKFYFYSNRCARRFFDNKINITDAIQKNTTVYGRYKVRSLNYKKLIGMLDL